MVENDSIEGMTLHRVHREQWVAHPIDEVFDFFSRAENLERITPPWLGFRILPPKPGELKQGATIAYALRIHGIPVKWRTSIERWEPPREFVDVQEKGPYRVWRHTHRFSEVNGGTLLQDDVEYALPFGFLGRIVNRLQVAGDVAEIFDYRERRIRELFA
jgi:ligand-binding SRPBCC domain-containing protein